MTTARAPLVATIFLLMGHPKSLLLLPRAEIFGDPSGAILLPPGGALAVVSRNLQLFSRGCAMKDNVYICTKDATPVRWNRARHIEYDWCTSRNRQKLPLE